jgi:hypothetical protein
MKSGKHCQNNELNVAVETVRGELVSAEFPDYSNREISRENKEKVDRSGNGGSAFAQVQIMGPLPALFAPRLCCAQGRVL